MSSFRFLPLLWATTLLFGFPASQAQDARGIAIRPPKAFDNRTLNLMLERLNGQLPGIYLIDQKSLAQAIGTIQGSSQQDSSSSFSVPATDPSTSNSTPAAPSLPDLLTAPSAFTNAKYGMSSSDLLTEQVDLTYQIFNIQMVLDRALSDRLLNRTFTSRLQTVVGFNVSIDPPRDAENAVAIVEITLSKKGDGNKNAKRSESITRKPDDATSDGPSLVAVMPQEHTYNSIALSSKSRAFGGSAVSKFIAVGFSERHRGQTLYVFRDSDTVSFERQSSPVGGSVTFGWAFRPVLGRKSVAPGSRQLFAVISLPEDDSTSLTRRQTVLRTVWQSRPTGANTIPRA